MSVFICLIKLQVSEQRSTNKHANHVWRQHTVKKRIKTGQFRKLSSWFILNSALEETTVAYYLDILQLNLENTRGILMNDSTLLNIWDRKINHRVDI